MPMLAVNPAAFRSLLSPLAEPANKNLPVCNGRGGRRPSYGALRSSRLAAMAADFFRQNADENFVLECVCRRGSPPWFGHRFGGFSCALRQLALLLRPGRPAGYGFPPNLVRKVHRKDFPGASVNAELRHLGAWPTRFDGAPIQIGNSTNGDTT
jgi:hypothetical protein